MTAPTGPRCGVVGLGNMGSGIAATLRDAGLLGAVCDSHATTLGAFGDMAHGIEAVAGCDVILLVVPGTAQIAGLFDAGLLQGPPGRVLIDMTTSDPVATQAMAARAADGGVAYLDAGMSGGAAGAQAGRLTLMIGGPADALNRANTALTCIASQIFHVGPIGAGHTMKLVHNMICHTIFLATAEGCRAAERAGISLDRAVAVLNAGNACSFVSERRFPDHIISETFDGRSVTANLAKDLAMAHTLFDNLGQPSAYVGLTAALLAQGEGLDLMAQDFTRLYPAYDTLVDGLNTNTP
ncbi:NAD(P)-dependent oxidoreductase [Paracoccus sp. Ld10]|uniref:NAD(P)-dependent oxidoreductase n=1 Tax=Paracoccus sp. Ld10 TaxID=649158 RepID=UPI00386CA3C6